MAGPGDNTRSELPTARPSHHSSVMPTIAIRRRVANGLAILVAASVGGCGWHVYKQKGTNRQFLEGTFDPSGNMLASYRRVPEVFIRRATDAGASCAKTKTGTLCVYFYQHVVHAGTEFWIWNIHANRIDATRQVVGGINNPAEPSTLHECGYTFKEQQLAYLRHLGGEIECEIKALNG